jgi:hypothetical protein
MKHFLRAFLCLAFTAGTLTSFSQSTGYVSCPDPSNNSSFVKMIPTSDNGFISLGISGNAGANHEIVKWDQDFHVQWTLNFPMAAVLLWNGIVEANDGNFFAMGANQNHTACNIVFKIDPAGTLLWQKEYYLGGNFLTSFCISKTAGNDDPGFLFGGGACGASNFIVRCDGDGNIRWQKEYYITGGSGVESIWTITPQNDSYIITGDIGINTDLDAFILKIDSASTVTWCKLITSSALPQVPVQCLRTAAGNFILQCDNNSNQNHTKAFYYFDANGNVTNAVKLTSPSLQEISIGGFAEVTNGRIILNGSVNASPMSFLYMELDASGAIVWQKKSVGVNATNDNGTGSVLAKTATNLYALGGSASGDGKAIGIIDSTGVGFCNSSLSTLLSGPADLYTVAATTPTIIPTAILVSTVTNASLPLTITPSTLCGTVGWNEAPGKESTLHVYPNPVTHMLAISLGEKTLTNAAVTFYNVLGEKVYAVSVSSPAIDVSMLTAGVYLLEVVVDGERVVRRVVKE